MITRLNPPVDSIDPTYLTEVGASAVVTYAGTAYIQGVTPMRGRRGEWNVVGVGSFPEQLLHVLHVIDQLLASIGSDRSDLLALSVFVTDPAEFSRNLPLLAAWTGDHRPAVTSVGVSSLATPEQMIEISAVARTR